MEESTHPQEEKSDRKVWLQYLFKFLIAFCVVCFFLGFFLFAYGYTAYGWSTSIAWNNSTCAVLSVFSEHVGNYQYTRNLFQVSSSTNQLYRRAAVTSMLDALFLGVMTPLELANQASLYVGRSNVSCYIPQVTIPFSQSSLVLGALSYYRVNSARNFIVLDYTRASLDLDVDKWRSFVIAGSVLICCGVLFGVILFLWWLLFLREKHTHRLVPSDDRKNDYSRKNSYRKPV